MFTDLTAKLRRLEFAASAGDLIGGIQIVREMLGPDVDARKVYFWAATWLVDAGQDAFHWGTQMQLVATGCVPVATLPRPVATVAATPEIAMQPSA